jgi:hypothetical protein
VWKKEAVETVEGIMRTDMKIGSIKVQAERKWRDRKWRARGWQRWKTWFQRRLIRIILHDLAFIGYWNAQPCRILGRH